MQLDPRIDFSVRATAAIAAALWGGLAPMVQLLVILMAIDIVTGFLVAAIRSELSSSVSLRGVTRKALILCLVAVAAAVQGYAHSLGVGFTVPLASIAAAFYAAHEGLSIIENATEAGLPVPRVLVASLAKLDPEGTPRKENSNADG